VRSLTFFFSEEPCALAHRPAETFYHPVVTSELGPPIPIAFGNFGISVFYKIYTGINTGIRHNDSVGTKSE